MHNQSHYSQVRTYNPDTDFVVATKRKREDTSMVSEADGMFLTSVLCVISFNC